MISLGCQQLLIYTWCTITFYVSLALIDVLGWCSGGPHENNTIKLWSINEIEIRKLFLFEI